ncbi:MAG: MltA domain-containing protein [Desulfamplus sp.]|nr:MltA domain-containing protein [Desulfamplus sp.]
MKNYTCLYYVFVILSLLICSCSESVKKPRVVSYYPLLKLDIQDYPDFRDDNDKADLVRSIKQSIIYYKRVPQSTLFKFGEETYDALHMLRSLEYFLLFMEIDPSHGQINAFIKKHYAVYTAVKEHSPDAGGEYAPVKEADTQVLFTGYYEPSIPGSRIKDSRHPYPLYSRPNDLIIVRPGLFSSKYKGEPSLSGRIDHEKRELVPYYTRAEINAKKGYEEIAKPVAWLESRVDRFFLEIQGSGRVVLEDGSVMRVQYNSKNGRPYRAIGKYLIDKGEIPREEVSMQTIRHWLEAHPERMDEVLHYNPGVVFFQEGKGGPYGCLGVEVTPMRSIATDVSIFPKGSLCFIETTIPAWNGDDVKKRDERFPDGRGSDGVWSDGGASDGGASDGGASDGGASDGGASDGGASDGRTSDVRRSDGRVPLDWQSYSGFVLNQDTGGAIKGAGRADLFCGNGPYAEHVAGHMKQAGRLYFLVLEK